MLAHFFACPISKNPLNKCRIFLRALTDGDLLEASSTFICHNAFMSPTPIDHHNYNYFAGSKQNSKGTKIPIVSNYVHPVVKSDRRYTKLNSLRIDQKIGCLPPQAGEPHLALKQKDL